jgi:hypothetical protein
MESPAPAGHKASENHSLAAVLLSVILVLLHYGHVGKGRAAAMHNFSV